MQCWGCRGWWWIPQMKAHFSCEFQSHAPLHQCEACLHAFHVLRKKMEWLLKGCALNVFLGGIQCSTVHLLLTLKEFCDIIQYPYHVWKHKANYLCTSLDEDTQMFCCLEIVPYIFFGKSLYFPVQFHIWNASRQTPHWR